jgi:glycosyltransferase involved in cell wall biosynthesis
MRSQATARSAAGTLAADPSRPRRPSADSPRRSPEPARRHLLQLIETGGPGGAERVVVSLAARLARDPQWKSTVGLLKEGWLKTELGRQQIETCLFQLRRPIDPRLVLALTRHLRQARVGVVHAHEFTMTVYGAAAGGLARVPVVATVHGRGYFATARRRVFALWLAARQGATMVAVSKDIQDFLVRLGLGHVRLIPNGIDVERAAGGDRARGRAAMGLSGDVPLVGTVGNLYPVKGHQVLLSAAARLDRRVHIAIAGRGGEEAALKRQAGELGLGDRLHLLGYREDVPDLLAAFDIYALPSFSEGQSLALIEAMAAGLPVAATAVGGNPEVMGEKEGKGERGEGPAGLLVPPGDPEALGAALARLLADRPGARELGERARARARGEFSLEVMLGRYRALYAERLGQGTTDPGGEPRRAAPSRGEPRRDQPSRGEPRR